MIDLTLILLAKDRPKFLERWIDYTIAKKPKCKIIISDGGKKKINKKNLLKLSKNKLNFKYIKFGYDKDYRQFCKKIYTSVKICSTKYIVLCADDDFLFIEVF